MELVYSCGIVSYCPDLTVRSAPSLPVGALLIGHVDSDGIAAVLVPRLTGQKLDEVTREVLMSVPDLLRLHVDEITSESAEKPLTGREILLRLHDKLRNSLYVSEITDEKRFAVGDPVQSSVLYSLLQTEYESALRAHGWTTDAASGKPAAASKRDRQNVVPGLRVSLEALPDAESMFRFSAPRYAC